MSLTVIPITGLSSDIANSISAAGTSGPKVNSIQPSNSTYSANGGANVSTSGGYVIINGNTFNSGVRVIIDETPATTVSLVSSARLNVQIPAKSAGTYILWVVNTDGGVGSKLLSFS